MLIKKYKIKPKKSVYFDDLEKNLAFASSLGITTIHISKIVQNKNNSHIDLRFKTIINALDMIIQKLKNGKKK